jgi:PAS domain S-box-containing protein
MTMPSHAVPESRAYLSLHDAFLTFDQAAESLQESYRILTARVERLDGELAASNEALRVHLADNERMRHHLHAVLESLTTGVLVADERGTIVRCNRSAETLLGRTRERLIGQSLTAVMDELNLAEERYPLLSPTGAPLSLTRAVLRNGGDHPHGSLLLLHDISVMRRLEERLLRHDRLAAMGDMVGRLAHEIRNPLGSIELFASLLKKDLAAQPGLRRYADHISMAVRSMDRLLSNLLIYTRPNCPRLAWHEPGALLQDVQVLTAHAAAHAEVRLKADFGAAPPRIWCDAGQIRQALVNLLLNAIHASARGSTVTVVISAEPDAAARHPVARLAVADRGIGIEPQHLPRLFDPYFTTKEEGTGLGLAIVHAVVDGHGGRVEVESRPGEGSTFSIVLPNDGAVRATIDQGDTYAGSDD